MIHSTNPSQTADPIGSPIVIDRYCDSVSIVKFGFRKLQSCGSHPFAESMSAEFAVAPLELLDDRWTITRAVQTADGIDVLAIAGDDAVWMQSRADSTSLICGGSTLDRVSMLVAEMRARIDVVVADRSASTSKIRLWHASNNVPARFADKRLATLEWQTISANYPPATRTALDRLMSFANPPASTGRLVLWHGEPGTGKTSAARALMHGWGEWCSTHYIADPDQFFHSAGYIAEVLANPGGSLDGPTLTVSSPGATTWKLIIAEDCDEYLRASARQQAGASLGRLLNLTDGLLGQGTNTIMLLTTNEPLGRLHPAITRPGRCLAVTEFPRFTPAEVADRVSGAPSHKDLTLAEIYEFINQSTPISASQPLAIGQYL